MASPKLPNKLSKLIRIALEDLEKCEVDSFYLIDMYDWVLKDNQDESCSVCFAGAVMVNRYSEVMDKLANQKDNEFFYFLPCDVGDERKLIALENIRVGKIHAALSEFGFKYYGPVYTFKQQREIDRLSLAPVGSKDYYMWKMYMCDTIAMLESRGL